MYKLYYVIGTGDVPLKVLRLSGVYMPGIKLYEEWEYNEKVLTGV